MKVHRVNNSGNSNGASDNHTPTGGSLAPDFKRSEAGRIVNEIRKTIQTEVGQRLMETQSEIGVGCGAVVQSVGANYSTMEGKSGEVWKRVENSKRVWEEL